MKHLTILGSTGSIGINTLRVVRQFPDRFRIKALAAKTSVDVLSRQVNQFHPEVVAEILGYCNVAQGASLGF